MGWRCRRSQIWEDDSRGRVGIGCVRVDDCWRSRVANVYVTSGMSEIEGVWREETGPRIGEGGDAKPRVADRSVGEFKLDPVGSERPRIGIN